MGRGAVEQSITSIGRSCHLVSRPRTGPNGGLSRRQLENADWSCCAAFLSLPWLGYCAHIVLASHNTLGNSVNSITNYLHYVKLERKIMILRVA